MKGLILASLALNLGLAGYFLYSHGSPRGSASVQRIIQRKGATLVILTHLPSASLTKDKRSETLKAMKVATEKELAEVLGEAGWGKYKKRHGWWLENVAR